AEKAKHDEKETKKLQDSLQSVQLRLSAREHICRTLQEKVRDLENQLAEERKTRQKQENRALAAASSHSSLSSLTQGLSTISEKRPPLGPSSKMRLPLRRISNFMPAHPSPAASQKPKSFSHNLTNEDKENLSRTSSSMKPLSRARRGSIAVKPAAATLTSQILKPKRRASIATTFQSETNSSSSMMTTPIMRHNAAPRMRNDRVVGRQSFVWDPQRVWRTSRTQSPLGPAKGPTTTSVEATP
ncbi:hypothetical protein M8C21_012920, partial [Ambrosia artemisiifolia]